MQMRLLHWFDRNKRCLPWRLKNPDPYKTWISEMMLQQTQVETVLPYYDRFLKAFPTVRDLARASLEDVLRLWSGLGYYSRARNLHKAAQIVVHKRHGRFPDTKKELLQLPGIGEYSAGAIASIAFGEKVPVVDGNVIRVLTRLFVLKGDPRKKNLKQKLWRLAEGLVPPKKAGDFNQAMMELGALVCLSKNPKCPSCPLQGNCKAFHLKKVADYPNPTKKMPTQKITLAAAVIEKRGRYLLVQRNGKRHLQSMWEFPQTPLEEKASDSKKLVRFLRHCFGVDVVLKNRLPLVRHAIMNRRIFLMPFLFRYCKGQLKPKGGHVAYKWIAPGELAKFPTSSVNHKVIRQLKSCSTAS